MASLNQSQVVSKTLDVGYLKSKQNASMKWGPVNALLFGILAYDLNYKCPFSTTNLQYLEYFFAVIFGLNTLYHVLRYFYSSFKISPVVVTPQQKVLLGFCDNDTSFKLKYSSEAMPVLNSPTQPSLLNLSTRSWRVHSSPSDSMNQSLNSINQSVSSPSWVYQRGSPSMPNYKPHHLDFTGQSDSIVDEHSLQEYLRNVEESEKNAALNNSFENTPKDHTIFWNHPSTRAPNDLSPMLKKNQYQLAPLNTDVPHALGVNDEGSPKSSQGSPQIWRKLNLDPQHLIQWNENIRKWLSATILDRVVEEIKSIDEGLLRHGLTDVRIGHVGLDRLKKTGQTYQIMQYLPTLPILVPFMEISNNQEYLVQRIKELASGGCMSDFKWNGGGNLHGKSWDESLPTDSSIIMHFFATYLDTQLLPVTQNPEGLPFTSQHFCKVPDKPQKTPDSLIIHQTCINPPHYVLIIGEETCEVSKGRNNLIYTLLLFLHIVANKHHGMLGRVNLGKSGVNVLWVVDQ